MLSADRKNLLCELANKINVSDIDFTLLDIALTHPSFNSERNIFDMPDYERLEFLGDSVLRLVMSNSLFLKYPDFDEGKLTKIRSYLVSDAFLSVLAENIRLDKYLNIGRHEEKDGGRKKTSVLACSLEAVFGAVFSSLGFKKSEELINGLYNSVKIDVNDILYRYNAKEILQEYTQGLNKNLPEYRILKETGADHDKTYEVCVVYNNEVLGSGVAKSKKEAEKTAAFNALKKLNLVEE